MYEGVPGSGKTYDVIRKLLSNLKKGRKIYTNVDGLDKPECLEAIKTYTGYDDYQLSELLNFIDMKDIKRFWEFVDAGSMVIIDEVHKWFHARDWKNPENKSFGIWASEHRKAGHDLILITQRIGQCEKTVRTLAEWIYSYKKINFFGSLVNNSYTVKAYAGCDTDCAPLMIKKHKYDPEIFPCYKSYVGDDIQELGIQKHANILKSPIFFLIPIVLVIFLYTFSQSSIVTGDIFGTGKAQADMQDRLIENKGTENDTETPVPAVKNKQFDRDHSENIPKEKDKKNRYVKLGFINRKYLWLDTQTNTIIKTDHDRDPGQ